MIVPERELERQGYDVTFLPTDEKGVISLNDLENALTDDTVLVAMMHVNNEIGSVMPVAEGWSLNLTCVAFADSCDPIGVDDASAEHCGIAIAVVL